MKLGQKALLPAAVLVGSLVASAALVVARPAPEAQATRDHRPLVTVIPVEPGAQRLRVLAQGTVEPRTENELVAEVGGRLAWLSQSFESGSFFTAGELLARIEPADYEIALERARAALERARSQRQLAEASLSRSDKLHDAGAASNAAHDQAESNTAIAAANQREAEAALRQAELELSRTEVRAPFAGRARDRTADVGQLLARGARLGAVYAVDWAEVRLPIRSDELAFLELPTAAQDGQPAVRLRGQFAGLRHTWSGQVVRAEGTLDTRTRLVHLVVRVADPYGLANGAPPLAVGVFVEAEIDGRELALAVRLPRSALHNEGEVVLVDTDGKLETRRIEVLRVEGETVVVSAGLAAGERVVAQVPSAYVEGMSVQVGEQRVAAAASGVP